MILEYGAKNSYSFKDWLQISFEAARKDVPDEYKIKGTQIMPYLCLEGSNASGKTNALKVLYFIISFIRDSFNSKPNEKVIYDTYFYNNEKAEFYLNFTLDDYLITHAKYFYELTLDDRKVQTERLSEKIGTKGKKIVFDRRETVVKDKYFNTPNNLIYRGNVSFFSTLFQYEIEKCNPFKDYFSKVFSNVSYFGTFNLYSSNISKLYYDNPDVLKTIKQDISRFDLGLVDVKVKKRDDPSLAEEDNYYPVFYHKTEDGLCPLFEYSQSAGTKKLYYILLYFYYLISDGGLLIMDEVDRELHDEIVKELLLKFSRENNPKGAQIIFTSYNSRLLDTAKKYRSYFFEKENGESFCYRADEIPLKIRNDRSLTSLYNNGELGGRPNIDKNE